MRYRRWLCQSARAVMPRRAASRYRARLQWRDRLVAQALLQVRDRRVELRVSAARRRNRQVVDFDIGRDAAAFDQPAPLHVELAELRDTRHPVVTQAVAVGEP